jgi:hypothetical protein
MDNKEQTNAEKRAIILMENVLNDLKDVISDYEDKGIPGPLLIAPIIKIVRFYADEYGIPLDRIQKAIETAY